MEIITVVMRREVIRRAEKMRRVAATLTRSGGGSRPGLSGGGTA